MCIYCSTQFPVELHSHRMRAFPLRPEVGEVATPQPPDPNSAAGTIGAGNRAPATIASAAAVMAIDASQGKDKTGVRKPRAASAASRVSNDAERQRARDQLRAEWYKWQKTHGEDIHDGGKTVEKKLD